MSGENRRRSSKKLPDPPIVNEEPLNDVGTPSKNRRNVPTVFMMNPDLPAPIETNIPTSSLDSPSHTTLKALKAKSPSVAKHSHMTTSQSTETLESNIYNKLLVVKELTTSNDKLIDGTKDHLSNVRQMHLQPITRQRSLVRPERSRSRIRTKSVAPPTFSSHPDDELKPDQAKPAGDWWKGVTSFFTWWIPTFCLSKCGGMRDSLVQQAWREKFTLCSIIFLLCVMLGYITFGLQMTICPEPKNPVTLFKNVPQMFSEKPWVAAKGKILNAQGFGELKGVSSKDVSALFQASSFCQTAGFGTTPVACQISGLTLAKCLDPSSIGANSIGDVAYEWADVKSSSTRIVVNGRVWDFQAIAAGAKNPFGDTVDQLMKKHAGQDATRAVLLLTKNDNNIYQCLKDVFDIGPLNGLTFGCLASETFLYLSLIVILGVVFIKFFLAIYFAWFMKRKLGKYDQKAPTTESVNQYLEQVSRPSKSQRASRFSSSYHRQSMMRTKSNSSLRSMMSGAPKLDSTNSDRMYTILLVTCYSEGEEGIRDTIQSLTETSYDDDQKLIFVVADGLIKGSGNDKSTPDIILGIIDLDPRFDEPEAKSYVAIADGSKRHNMAKVYCGHYTSNGHRAPVIVVVKCGTPAEAKTAKPGNRGKRDSQIILMSFFSKVLFDDRMSPLEYDLFEKMILLTGVFPDQFELILMVDADTKVKTTSLNKMVNAMRDDKLIMGLCGETKIENKAESWVTAIQVFEYYISHHLAKAFESIFGGVTCLPGCFCMYRIKAPKGDSGYWVPILANPDIINQYSENITDTLHKKNLLLLGEDRFLTTLMLRIFPTRKMMFVPRATCKTTVPAQFRVLLSQRRRWINSTIHNLLELILVRDLCGTFCCSMQFVIFMELFGSVVLPAAISFTIVLIVMSLISTPQIIPLILLAAILGLPAVLILMTTNKIQFVFWMIVYLLSLPIWNFVLPAYAFWHFDDFSWGQTRKVEGESAKDGHGQKDGEFDASGIIMRRWKEWQDADE
ncbi:Fungal chitin synthase domain-containing protein [Rozella allomycis CSF55]|uniref:chitin synthase n=1 Tax=Rozella allomycis (strain CSF55) TaxID=988480 RepID=A0A075ATR3_ROZAC|nr:Fungal chitin synthase domain-containing protein [Rozella allomycis CSF55]|eukprot:EPZ33633.1 Fungal chitin synthase domain-containing protein [Rozella allomycis CSF55]